MPLYLFKHPDREEYEEVFFHMDEDKVFEKEGLLWQRVYHSPNLNTEAPINPWDNNDFVNKTKNKKGTIGDMMDASAELSAKRADQNGGVDPVKQKYFKDYAKKRNGTKHHLDKKTIDTKNFKIDF